MAAQVGTAALHASTSLSVGGLRWIIGGITQYYVTETSVNPAQPYTIESTASNYTTEDGLEAYTVEDVRQRYITEAGVNTVGPFYVAAVGIPPATIFAARAVLTARPRAIFHSTAEFDATTALFANPGVLFTGSAALTAATTLQASATFGLSGFATLSARATLAVSTFVPSFVHPFAAGATLTATPVLHAAGFAAFNAGTTLFPGVSSLAEALLAAVTTLFGDGEIVAAPQVLARSLLKAATTLFGYGTRAPFPPSIVGHALVYIVNAPIAAQLTSDPVIGPLIDNSGVSVWHTQTNSVTQLPGAWNVIFKFNQPFDLDLALSQKCVLIYDQTALVQRKSSLFVILKNDITPPLADLEIDVDGFGSLIQPSTLPSLIGF